MALDTFNPYLFVSAGEQSNKYLTPTITNGIAQFQAQRAQSITGLTVRIDPIQEGTGDPSPTNIRPISGRTGMTVTACGKNLVDASTVWSAYVQEDGSIKNPLGTTKAYFPTASIGKAVTVSALAMANTENSNLRIRCVINGETRDSNFVRSTTAFTMTSITVTPVSEEDYFLLTSSGANGTYKDLQLEIGTSATDYEPYAGQTYPISWQTEAGTIYGGTLDVVSGVLTVDRVCVTFTENDDWTGTGSVSGGSLRYYVLVPVAPDTTKSGATTMCSCAVYSTGNTGVWGTYNYNANSGAFFIKNGDGGAGFTSLDDFKTWLSTHPVQLCYYLATPQTYNITPTDVKTLAGFNQIYSDAGPVIDIKF